MKNIIIFYLLVMNYTHAKISVEYSRVSNIIEVLDSVSGIRNSTSLYKNEWIKRFGDLNNEKNFLNSYRSIRSKFKSIQEKGSLFYKSPYNELDTFNYIFYTSKNFEAAFNKLKKTKRLSKKELKIFRQFMIHYKKEIQYFVNESVVLRKKAKELYKIIKYKQFIKNINKLEKFLSIGSIKSGQRDIRIQLTWNKSLKESYSFMGNILLLRISPLKDVNELDLGLLFKNIYLSYFYQTTVEQRKRWLKIFNKECDGRVEEFKVALETIWLKTYPIQKENKKNFSLYKKWSEDIFIDTYIKLIFPLFETSVLKKRKTFDEDFLYESSRLCRQLNLIKESK